MKKIVLKNNKIIKSDKYSTIEISLIFPCENKKEYLFYVPLLKQILLNSSYEYKDEKSYRQAYKERMIINQSIYLNKLNKNLFLEFVLVVPDPKCVKGYNLEEAIKFFTDTIYKPNIIDNAFNIDSFNREKEFLKNDINGSLKNVNNSSFQSFINIVDDIGIYKDNIYNNLNLIEEANNIELYNIYKQLILNNNPLVTIYGNVDKEINDIINKYIKTTKEISFNKDYNNFFIPFKKVKDITEDSKYNQSILYVGYKVKDMQEKDIIYMNLIKNIIDHGSNDLLIKKLRYENSFVYSCSCWCYARSGLLVNEVYINNNSKDEVVKNIQELIDSLKDKKFMKECLDKQIEDVYYNSIRAKDSRVKPLDDYINSSLELRYSIEELLEKYKEIDIDDLIEFIKRLKLDTIYFLRGEFNE